MCLRNIWMVPQAQECVVVGSPSPVRMGSDGTSPSFMRFFCFILRFWNQTFTWVSLSCSVSAISIRLALVKYLLKWNSFSNSVSIFVVKFVFPGLFIPPPGLGRPPPRWSYGSEFQKAKILKNGVILIKDNFQDR